MSRVDWVKVDPVLRLEALLDGLAVPDHETALAEAEVDGPGLCRSGSGVVPVPRAIDEAVAAAYVALAGRP